MTKNFKSFFSVANIVNKKGQGIVEFALLCAFCVGIGLAAREAGLGEALDKAFAGTSDTAAPSAILDRAGMRLPRSDMISWVVSAHAAAPRNQTCPDPLYRTRKLPSRPPGGFLLSVPVLHGTRPQKKAWPHREVMLQTNPQAGQPNKGVE